MPVHQLTLPDYTPTPVVCPAGPLNVAPSGVPPANPTTGFSPNPQIGAAKSQVKVTGKGVKVGIIDSGIDYTRTPLGGCLGSGCKVAGGFNFTNTDGSINAEQCNFHGTAVAGLIAANDNEFNVPGVAPDATLYSYVVFNCDGYSSDALVIAAMQRAYQEGMNVINLSIGESEF